MDVERAERRDDHEVRQDERPAAGPRAPEAAAQIGDVDADLDRERPRQRLADRRSPRASPPREPAALGDQFAFHLSDQRDRTAETGGAEAQEERVSSIRDPRGLAVTPVAFELFMTPRRSTVVASFQLSYVD